MENLIFLFHFLRLTLLHYIYPNPRLSFHFFILFWLLCAFYYCKSLLPTIGRLDPRVPPDSVLLHSTVKLAPLNRVVKSVLRCVVEFCRVIVWHCLNFGVVFNYEH